MNDDLVNKLIKLASGGVNVNVDLVLGAQGLPADPETPALRQPMIRWIST